MIKVDAASLRKFNAALKGADREIRAEFSKSIQRATRPVKEVIHESARDTLPKRGGLNEWAAAIGIKTASRLGGKNPSVVVTGALDNKRQVRRSGGRRSRTRKAGTFGAKADVRALNRGRVMHPAWGRGPLVGPQMVPTGFWDKPLEGEVSRTAQQEIHAAMERAAKNIADRAG